MTEKNERQEEREAFEVWARERGHPICDMIPKYGAASSRPETTLRFSDIAWEAWQAALVQQPQAAPVPQGVTITEEMLIAGAKSLMGAQDRGGVSWAEEAKSCFEAMIAQSAPSASAQQAEPVAAKRECSACDGSGGLLQECRECHGTGSMDVTHEPLRDGYSETIGVCCDACQGTGNVDTGASPALTDSLSGIVRRRLEYIAEAIPGVYSVPLRPEEARAMLAAPAPSASPVQHPDDVAVDMFAKAMKEKLALARAKGRGGWQTCNKYELTNMLREHVDKGDPRDVANFCMFLYALGHSIQIAPSASPECTCPSGNGSLRHPCPAHPASPWESINPTATLADRLDQLPEINFSNYDQGDVEVLQAWAIEAHTLLAATLAERKCTRCEYIGHCDCEVTEGKSAAKCDGTVCNCPNECSAPCSPIESPADQIEILLRAHEHDPTIAIELILDEFEDNHRETVWEAIKVYAEIHARGALQRFLARE